MTQKTKILMVDDDPNIAELASLYLIKEGYEVRTAVNGRQALDMFMGYAPNLVLLDIMLPQMDGYDVCKEILRISRTPVIMLTAKADTFDKVLGLEFGADDYIVKPFEPKELVARIKAVLRRCGGGYALDSEAAVYPNLMINLSNYDVIYHGVKIDMPPKELELLYFLATNQGKVFKREQLLDKICGYDFLGDTRTVDVHIKRIREKLDRDDPFGITTVWGIGYKFEAYIANPPQNRPL